MCIRQEYTRRPRSPLMYSLIDTRHLNTPEASSGSIMMLKKDRTSGSVPSSWTETLAEVRSVVFVWWSRNYKRSISHNRNYKMICWGSRCFLQELNSTQTGWWWWWWWWWCFVSAGGGNSQLLSNILNILVLLDDNISALCLQLVYNWFTGEQTDYFQITDAH